MKKELKMKFGILMTALLFMTVFMTSCSDNNDSSLDSETVENFVNQSVYSFQEESNAGKFGCFEFVFPITIAYPDGTTEEAADYEALRANIKEWIEANGESLDLPARDSSRRFRFGYKADIPWDQLPTLVFPVEVLSSEGEATTISSREELFELKKTCRKDFYGGRGKHDHGRGDRCFTLVFPITLDLPDGGTITATDSKDLKTQLRAWKATYDGTERPSLQFPVTVQLEDESTQEIASKEDLEALKSTCGA
jgi:hypothetical protein